MARYALMNSIADAGLRDVERRENPAINIAAPPAPSRLRSRRARTADGGRPFLLATPVEPGHAPRPVAVGRIETRIA